MPISRIVPQSFYNYFKGFSELPLSDKVSRAAVPVLVGLACLGAGVLAAYHFCYRPKPNSKKVDLEIAPLKLSEEQLNFPPNLIVLNEGIKAYLLDLRENFPNTASHSYIISKGPWFSRFNSPGNMAFYQMANKAALLITIGSQEDFAFPEREQEIIDNRLRCVEGRTVIGQDCASYKLQLIPDDATVWLLNIKKFSRFDWMCNLNSTLEMADKFIEDNRINLEDRSIVVSDLSGIDESGLFIMLKCVAQPSRG